MTHDIFNRMCIITTKNHKDILKDWTADLSVEQNIEIANETYDLTKHIKEMLILATDVVVIDDAALTYSNNETQLATYVGEIASDKLKIVFVGSPQRKNKDPLITTLLDANMTSILLTRYFDNNKDGAKNYCVS